MPDGKFCGRCGAPLQQAQPQQAQPQPIQQAQPQQQAATAASSFMSAIASTPASQPVQMEDDAEEESAPTSLAAPAMRHHVPKVTKAAQTPPPSAAPAASPSPAQTASFADAIASTPAAPAIDADDDDDDSEEEFAPTSLATPAMRRHVPKVTKAAQTPTPAAQTGESSTAATDTRRPNPFDEDSAETSILPPAQRHKTPKAQYAGQPTQNQTAQPAPAQNPAQQNAQQQPVQPQYAWQSQPEYAQQLQNQQPVTSQPYATPQPSYQTLQNPYQQNAYQPNTTMPQPTPQPQPVESLVHMPAESSTAPATKKRRGLRKKKAEAQQAAQLEAQQAAQQAQSYLVGPRADQPMQNLTQPAPFAPTSKAPQGEEEPQNDAPITSSSEVPHEEKKGHKASAIVMTVALVLMVAAGGFAGYEAFLDPARTSAQPAATATVDRSQYDGTWIEVIQNADGTMKTGNVYTVSGNNVCQYTSQDAQGVTPETCSWAVSDSGVVRISFADRGSVPLAFNSDKTALVPATATPGGTILRRVDTK